MREMVRRLLAWGVTLSVFVPMAALVVLGLGGLLASLDDDIGARLCRRVGLVLGVFWFLSLAVTAIGGGIVALEAVSREVTGGDSIGARPADKDV